MKASFQFAKFNKGRGHFAQIGLESTLSPAFSVKWAKDVAQHERNNGDAVYEGIDQALRWHRNLGGGSSEFTVLEFTLHMEMDKDAVRCAAAMAAWKSLGHLEAELTFDFDGTWHVRRSA